MTLPNTRESTGGFPEHPASRRSAAAHAAAPRPRRRLTLPPVPRRGGSPTAAAAEIPVQERALPAALDELQLLAQGTRFPPGRLFAEGLQVEEGVLLPGE